MTCGFCDAPSEGPFCPGRCTAAGEARLARGTTIAPVTPTRQPDPPRRRKPIAALLDSLDEKRAPRKRRPKEYPAAFRARAVARSQEIGIEPAAVEFGIGHTSIVAWRAAAGVGKKRNQHQDQERKS